jgi:hypothetical protein
MVTRHNINSYQSNAIRSGVFSNTGNKVLDIKAIGCNNVKNYESTECYQQAHDKVGE